MNDELVLLTAPYELGSGETVLIATCQFDKEDANKRVRQAEALAAYADQVKQNIVICASVYENESGNVFRWVLSIPFFISCIRQQNPLTVLRYFEEEVSPFLQVLFGKYISCRSTRIEIRLCVDSFVPELGNTGGSD